MNIYISSNCITDLVHAKSLGLRHVEFISGKHTGIPEQDRKDETINFGIDFDAFAQRMERVRVDTELLVLDVIERNKALRNELITNNRGQRAKVADWLGRIYRLAQSYKVLPTYFDGLPGGAKYWDDEILYDVIRQTGINDFSVTAYWGRGKTQAEYLLDCDVIRDRAIRANGQSPTVWQISIDPATSEMGDLANEKLLAVGDRAKERGVRDMILWRNSQFPLAPEQVEAIVGVMG